MSKTVDYYISLQSPWTYLGHRRLVDLAARHDASVNVLPVNAAVVFPATGGLPLAKRAPQRQAYRLTELRRWGNYLGVPLNLQPRHFPTDERPAMGMVTVLRERDPRAALRLAGNILAAVWAEEKNIADADTLLALATELELDGAELLRQGAQADAAIEAASKQAIERGVFGMPTYAYKGELFWGQDRLDFLDRALAD